MSDFKVLCGIFLPTRCGAGVKPVRAAEPAPAHPPDFFKPTQISEICKILLPFKSAKTQEIPSGRARFFRPCDPWTACVNPAHDGSPGACASARRRRSTKWCLSAPAACRATRTAIAHAAASCRKHGGGEQRRAGRGDVRNDEKVEKPGRHRQGGRRDDEPAGEDRANRQHVERALGKRREAPLPARGNRGGRGRAERSARRAGRRSARARRSPRICAAGRGRRSPRNRDRREP